MMTKKVLLFSVPFLFLCFFPVYMGEIIEPSAAFYLLLYWSLVFIFSVLFFLFNFFFETKRGSLRATEILFYLLALYIFKLQKFETLGHSDHYFYSRTNEFIFVYVIIIVLYFIFFRLLDKNPKSV